MGLGLGSRVFAVAVCPAIVCVIVVVATIDDSVTAVVFMIIATAPTQQRTVRKSHAIDLKGVEGIRTQLATAKGRKDAKDIRVKAQGHKDKGVMA